MGDCENCKATFALLEGGSVKSSDRALELDQREPLCRCQKHSVSEHSKGPVADNEVLIRLLVAPQHMHKKGGPKAGALSDAESHGLSLLREDTASDKDIRDLAEFLVSRARKNNGEKAGLFGVLRMSCATIREFCAPDEDKPCYCVYDTGLKDRTCHAEAFQRVANSDKAVHDLRRNNLFSVVRTTFVPTSEFRGGILNDLAPSAT